MRIRLPHWICFALISFLPFLAQAEIYKWTDENGQINYSQQPPPDRPAEQIQAPPPPPVEPDKAQQEIDNLIESQQKAAQQEAEQREAEQATAREQQLRDENCQIARENLLAYQNNPGRRFINEAGEVTRPTEEERQQRIANYQDQVDTYCQ
ncbi:Periplasmic protein TonB, links inner and outer membranes [Methylophaga frappieri]|uniref:Periplasmic protein TonB, links inner and outer membranes n=1 Tax=Methylophaga frappieri (strain ATCC BAA-2434 / DSM 25690 / JAM7) TaxID=754477 RepID=I1YKZ6_METFJ|nr:DUF4124 domain-containing protein [Methylophaga frappieri]AFJ03589.1 Periplasmic protein TonB, links inner and outer membranes [Methylophaga frappieri]